MAERSTIWLLEDTDDDLKCDRRTRLVRLDTPGNYPHNGLAGFAFDAMGWMYFGFGENLGAEYELIGSDGTTLSGGGEGGNVYRCRPDGSKLSLWATGFWNPHASCVDAFGRLFTVDNDPDSRPPCRLLHVIEGGDYGFKFKNGRKGLHPFTSWNGEIPGTLPMVSGTGEAPSGIVAYESDGLPEEYVGRLLVTSWGDHRIDSFELKPQGASFTSRPVPMIVGDADFRPVGLAVAPDGSLFCTDWVQRDYKIHGHGRIWRISLKQEPEREVVDAVHIVQPEKTSARQLEDLILSPRLEVRRAAARRLAERDVKRGIEPAFLRTDGIRENRRAWYEWMQARFLWKREKPSKYPPYPKEIIDEAVGLRRKLLQSKDDPFVRSRYVGNWAEGRDGDDNSLATLRSEFEDAAAFESLDVEPFRQKERIRTVVTLVARRAHPQDRSFVKMALASAHEPVRRLAVQWAAEENLKELRPQVAAVLDSEDLTPDLFLATTAALQMLDGVDPAVIDRTPPAEFALQLVREEKRPPHVRALALRLVPAGTKGLDRELLEGLAASNQRELKLEAIRTLQDVPDEYAADLARGVASDPEANRQLRAEAVMVLGRGETLAEADRRVLFDLLRSENDRLRAEAVRTLRPFVETDDEVREALERLKNDPALRDEVALALGEKAGFSEKPRFDADGGEPAVGRRAFFHRHGPGCAKCHTVDGRGGNVGPDLSLIARTMDRKKLAESILEPSKEVAPQFTNYTFVMADGRVHNGMITLQRGGRLWVGTPEGEVVELKDVEIERRIPQTTSVMPEKLVERTTSGEFRDLLAFLETLK